MKTQFESIRVLLSKHRAFILYGLISVFVTIIDILVCAATERALTVAINSNMFANYIPVISNTIGVIAGFIIQYFLTARHVYNVKNLKSFIVFFITFLINLLMADTIIFVFRKLIFNSANTMPAFLISKAASIIFPFFITYFIRKKLMPNTKEESNE